MTTRIKSKLDYIEVLLKERELMRAENAEVGRTLQKIVILFLSAAFVFVGFYLKCQINAVQATDQWILFSISQLAFIFFIFGVGVWATQTVYVGYIKALENCINKLYGCPLLIWESQVADRFTAKPKGAFFWAWFLIAACFVGMHFFLIVAYLCLFPKTWTSGVLVLEGLLAVVLLIWARLDLDRAEKFAASRMLLPANNVKEGDSQPDAAADG